MAKVWAAEKARADSIEPAAPGRTEDLTTERAVVAENAVNDEARLISKARSGDTGSFSALVELYQERAVRTARSFVGNLEDARDVAQDAFVKAYKNLGRFDSESRFYTWFYRILLNTCKDFLRKKKVRRYLSFWFGKNEPEEELDPVAGAPDDGRNAREELMDAETGMLIQSALEKLPFRQRSAFALRYLEGLSLEEIARHMQISEGAIKAELWHAAKKMRRLLKAYRLGEETP